jgi:hypothetical protein
MTKKTNPGRQPYAKTLDPVWVAWKGCNPRVPFPPQLAADRAGIGKRGMP